MSGGWWERPDLGYRDGRLQLAGEDLEEIARAAGTPLFLYSAQRAIDNLRRLESALDGTGIAWRVLFAVKANRNLPLLALLRAAGLGGVDVCSPRELLLARQVGFHEREISFTGTALSVGDCDCLVRHPEVAVQVDSLAAIRRLGERAPGRRIGLRVNPGVGLSYRGLAHLDYAGAAAGGDHRGRPTKFGLHREQFAGALQLAAHHGLEVAGLHFHCGSGYLTPQLAQWERVLAAAAWFVEQLPELAWIDVGGGLGVPLTADDKPLDLPAWAALTARRLRGAATELWVEPGNYLVKDAGLLVAEVNQVESKSGTVFVGVDAGCNLLAEPVFYGLPYLPVPVRQRPPAAGAAPPVTVAGNINEAPDLLASDVELPGVREGDLLAFLNAGGYGAAMSSEHCLRGGAPEYLLWGPGAGATAP